MKTIESKSLKIPVLDAGKGWLLVDKPTGISVHNSSGEDLCSLVSTFIREDMPIRQKTEFDSDFGVNPVHRLDKETSGIILLAVIRDVFRFFSKQFESREAKKQYVAIVHGLLEDPEEEGSWGIWQWSLSKAAGGRRNPAGSGQRLPCETRYRVIERSVHYTMLEIELHSGRTHQIRRHAKLSGHPVVGDVRYGSIRATNYLKENFNFDRLALHARSLTLCTDPGKDPKTIETQIVPDSLRILFANDRIKDILKPD